MVINNAPATMVLQNIKVGYALAYVGHSISTDFDILGRSFWLTEGTNVTRKDFTGLNTYYALLVGLKEETSYTLQGAYFDQIIDAELLTAKISINLSDTTTIKTVPKPTITKATSVSEQVDIGVGAPLLVVNTNGQADYVTLEAKKLPDGEWEKVYIGPLTPQIQVGIPIGKYRVRISGQIAMPDGVTVESSGTREFGQDVDVKYVFTPPSKPDRLVFKAARIADGKERYDVRLEWNWEKGAGAYAREFVVWYIDQESFATSGWANAQKINAGAAKAVTITTFPWNRTMRFKVQAVAWGPDTQAVVDSSETTYILNESTPLDDSFVNETGIEVNYAHIKGQMKDGNRWIQTFLLDAKTGSVSIGALDEKGQAPFNFDPLTKTLNVDGRVITNSIYAANFILTNLTGKDNPALYSQGKTYGGLTNGVWMGMDNTDGKFKFDMGSATKYIRWDGNDLNITGTVTIGTPNGNMSLEDGIIGNFQSYAYIKSPTAPPKPIDTSYPPTGWSTIPPNRLPGEVIWAIVGAINPFTNKLKDGTGWSDVARWTGDKGDDGSVGTSVTVQWSRTPTGPWHSSYEVGDLYMRQSTVDGWGEAIRVVGEDGEKGPNGDYVTLVFRASDNKPATPTGSAPVPAGWSDAPPTGNTPIWMSKGTVDGRTGTVSNQQWSDPIRLDGEDAQPLAVEWAVSANGPWHSSFQPGDKYMRQNVNGSWSAAIKAVGENGGDGTSGDYTNLMFRVADTKPARPTGSAPAGWSDAPPDGTPLWMTRGTFDGPTNALKGQWTDPVRIDGQSIFPNMFEARKWLDTITSVDKGTMVKNRELLTIAITKTGTDPAVGAFTIPYQGAGTYYIDVKPNTKYTMSYETDNAAAVRVLFLYFQGTNQTFNGYAESLSSKVGRSTFTFTTTNNTTRLSFRPSVMANGATVLFYNIKLEESNYPTAYVPAASDGIGEKGNDGTPMEVQYSADGSNWHPNFTTGDVYMRQRVGGTWSAAIRIVGEEGQAGKTGNYVSYIFRAGDTQPATPTGNTPAGWTDAPPTSGLTWMSRAYRQGSDNTVIGTWSTPVRLTGTDGKDGANGKDGVNAKNLTLTSTSQSFNYDGRGALKSSSDIVFTATKQNTAATIIWTARDNNNAVVTIPGGTELTKTLTSAIFGNALWVTVTVTCDGLTDAITVVRLVDGSNVLAGYLTNEAAVLVANSVGRVMDYGAGAGSMRVFYGTQDVTSQCTYSQVATNISASINTAGIYSLSGMPDNILTGFVDFTATHPQLGSIVKRMNVTKSVAAKGYNIVMTPTFEDGNIGTWDRGTVVDIPAELGSPPGTGFKKAYRMFTRDHNEGNNWINVSQGEKYRVTAWVYTKDTTNVSNFGLWMLNDAGANLTWYAGFSASAGNATWRELTGVITIPANAARARPWMQINATANHGVVLVTNIRMERMDMDGANGSDADPIRIEWSANASSWHTGYSPGDLYMRQFVDGAWSPAIRAVGQDGTIGKDGAKGDYTTYIYRQSNTTPATPTGNNPAGWSTTPPAGQPIWMSTGLKNGATDALIGNWSAPIQITGNPGPPGKDGTNGAAGQRGAGIFTQALNAFGVWHDGEAANFFQSNFGTGPVKYDVLTQYNSADPKISATRMWNGTAWVVPGLVVHGDMVVSGTIRSDKIVADTAMVNRLGVTVIYDTNAWNSGNAEANYKMKIDLGGGYIHIR
ncbi:tape measure protein [Serratia phage Slocum]|nr:tape measure protein [Serratia phage Slocum]